MAVQALRSSGSAPFGGFEPSAADPALSQAPRTGSEEKTDTSIRVDVVRFDHVGGGERGEEEKEEEEEEEEEEEQEEQEEEEEEPPPQA